MFIVYKKQPICFSAENPECDVGGSQGLEALTPTEALPLKVTQNWRNNWLGKRLQKQMCLHYLRTCTLDRVGTLV